MVCPQLPDDAQRWRRHYATDLIRGQVLEFCRLHEINAMRVFVESLRQRLGSPLSRRFSSRSRCNGPTLADLQSGWAGDKGFPAESQSPDRPPHAGLDKAQKPAQKWSLKVAPT